MSSKRKVGEIASEISRNVRPNNGISESIIEPKIFSFLRERRQKLLKEKESYETVHGYIYKVVTELQETSFFYKNERYINIRKISLGRRKEIQPQFPTCSNDADTAQVPYVAFDPVSCPFFKAKGNDSFIDYLLALLKNWDLDVYQKCMDEYNFLQRENPDIWTNLLLKVFFFIIIEHSVRPDVIADFFHAVSNGSSASIDILVRMKSSFLQYILMNMAAVNRVEHSMVLETDKWNFLKTKLIEIAFRQKEIENLRLFLLYFRQPSAWDNIEPDIIQFIKRQLSFLHFRAEVMNYPCPFDCPFNFRSSTHTHLCPSGSTKNGLQDEESMEIFSAILRRTYDFSKPCRRLDYSHIKRFDSTELFWRDSSRPYQSYKYFLHKLDLDSFALTLTEEIKEEMKNEVKDDDIQNYIKVFTRPTYKPRSLLHLSRCKLRQSLYSALHINFLPLPDKLKAYLNLEL